MKVLVIVLVSLLSITARADQTGGLITKLYVNGNNLVLFTLDKEVNNKPSCATNTMWQFAIDLENPSASEMYSLLLMAKASNQPIVVGYSACSNKFPSVAANYVFFNR